MSTTTTMMMMMMMTLVMLLTLSGEGPAESGGAEGEPSPKEPRREEGGGEGEGDARPPVEEKREDVEELVRLFNRYQRRPVSPNREQLFRQLPRSGNFVTGGNIYQLLSYG